MMLMEVIQLLKLDGYYSQNIRTRKLLQAWQKLSGQNVLVTLGEQCVEKSES
jgi:hypothetical protein